jgi:tetratricopeptide (TPR) repeat protein
MADPIDWYERERIPLVATIRQAAHAGHHELCWDLAISSVTLFESRSYLEDWRQSHEVALAATRQAGNQRGEAAMLYSLGALSLFERRFDEADRRLGQALEMFTELADAHGCGLAQRNLAYLERVRGNVDGAVTRYRQALDALRKAGDEIGEAHVLSNLAQVRIEQEDHPEAERLLAVALELACGAGARRVEAQIQYRLGEAYLHQGDAARSGAAFEAVLATVQAIGDPTGEAYALFGLGAVRSRLGQHEAAEPILRRAQRMAVQVGERLLVAQVFLALAESYRAAGELAAALDRATAARDLFAQLGAEPRRASAEQLIAEINEINQSTGAITENGTAVV